jgi:hypothetical protein
MTNALTNTDLVKKYQDQLPEMLQTTYKSIVEERTRIYYTGYILGFLLSALVIIYNTQIQKSRMSTTTMVCTALTISFVTSYFYYVLSPKKTHMLEHIKTEEQTVAWLAMYKGMQYHYHVGLVVGLVAVGTFAFAFRC